MAKRSAAIVFLSTTTSITNLSGPRFQRGFHALTHFWYDRLA